MFAMADAAQNASAVSTPVEIFVSYSHKDEGFRSELVEALSTLRREGVAVHWDDRKINPGDEWKTEIDQHLNSADIVLLLISRKFVHSDYCFVTEGQRAMQRYEAGEAQVIPVLVESCDWETLPFAKLQVLPEPATPVAEWDSRAAAWTSVAKGVRKAVGNARRRPRGRLPFRCPRNGLLALFLRYGAFPITAIRISQAAAMCWRNCMTRW